ncbi:MAG: sugar transferase [Paludibacteraceae bacterium]|nr:sugar transferase [Paludibacteraceae bacterium]
MKDKSQLYKYIVADAMTALVAWAILNSIRTMIHLGTVEFDYMFLLPEYNAKMVYPIIPFFWLVIYWISGYYGEIWFKSRLSELFSTLICTIIGSTILFFIILIDDNVNDYNGYYMSYLSLIWVHFILTYTVRTIITANSISKIREGNIGFNTLIIGTGQNAAKLFYDLEHTPKSTGFLVRGFIDDSTICKKHVPDNMILGNIADITDIIDKLSIEEIIVANDEINESKIYSILGELGGRNVKVKFIPSKYQFITGGVKLDTLYGIPMVDLSANKMNACEINIKRIVDVTISLLAMILLIPVYIMLFIIIGKKPIFKQERIGLHGKSFIIYKFRSMVLDAEDNGPMLSNENDSRVTKSGAFLRKYRLDEIPQFYNVLKGDMSLVGPRPERKFYIEQIVRVAPYYYILHNVKPGITSWGMVKYGYATSVAQMIDRSAYDILYIENASMLLDVKIMIYTIKIIFTGRGL